MNAEDIRWIAASFNVWWDANFAAYPTHWPDTEGEQSDAAWVEPWLTVTLDASRSGESHVSISATVNCFAAQSRDAYLPQRVGGAVAALLKAARVEVKQYGDAGTTIGWLCFDEPDVRDLGELTERKEGMSGRIGLRQISVVCRGRVLPLAA